MADCACNVHVQAACCAGPALLPLLCHGVCPNPCHCAVVPLAAEAEVLLKLAEERASGDGSAAATPIKQLLPPQPGISDIAADVSRCIRTAPGSDTCADQTQLALIEPLSRSSTVIVYPAHPLPLKLFCSSPAACLPVCLSLTAGGLAGSTRDPAAAEQPGWGRQAHWLRDHGAGQCRQRGGGWLRGRGGQCSTLTGI